MNKLTQIAGLTNRNRKGVGIMIIVFLFAFVILFGVGLFSFEVHRVQAARDELRSACEAAALAGASALASSNETDPSATHDLAETAAQQAFVTNSILGKLLSNTTFVNSKTSSAASTLASDPGPSASKVYVEFQKEDGSTADWTDPTGRIVNVVAVHGEVPSFGIFMNLKHVNVNARARGRVPLFDVVMCFDVSGSIDDQTKVSYVRRQWNAGASRIDYPIAVKGGFTANGSLYKCQLPGPTGFDVQAEPPQNLSTASGGLGRKFTFDPGLRGPTNTGSPPGNYPGGAAQNADEFTDLVVNLDGNDVFGGFSDGGFDYPNVAALVEASRGNLEDSTVFADSKANTNPLLSGITPKTGYQEHYWKKAHEKTQPIGAARQAAINFFKIMNNNTDAQFGLVTFGSPPPSISPTNTNPTARKVSGDYSPGGSFSPPYPGESFGAGKFTSITTDVIPRTISNGCTCMGDALQKAVDQLVAGKRPGAKAAVVFFTDGQPTCGVSWGTAATTAKAKGIAIYTIGLAQNAAIIPGECENLNDSKDKIINYVDPITLAPGTYDPANDGMAAVAGNGGKFFLVTNSDNLNYVFENIARQLVQLDKDKHI